MRLTGSGVHLLDFLPRVKPKRHTRPSFVFLIPAISSAISLLSVITDLGTVTPWLPGERRRRLPDRRLASQTRRWVMVKAVADIVLAATAIFGASVAKKGTTAEARLSYRQGMVFTALRLVFSPQVLRCVADFCFGPWDAENVPYDDMGLLTFRIWAVDIPAMYYFTLAVKHARAR